MQVEESLGAGGARDASPGGGGGGTDGDGSSGGAGLPALGVTLGEWARRRMDEAGSGDPLQLRASAGGEGREAGATDGVLRAGRLTGEGLDVLPDVGDGRWVGRGEAEAEVGGGRGGGAGGLRERLDAHTAALRAALAAVRQSQMLDQDLKARRQAPERSGVGGGEEEGAGGRREGLLSRGGPGIVGLSGGAQRSAAEVARLRAAAGIVGRKPGGASGLLRGGAAEDEEDGGGLDDESDLLVSLLQDDL